MIWLELILNFIVIIVIAIDFGNYIHMEVKLEPNQIDSNSTFLNPETENNDKNIDSDRYIALHYVSNFCFLALILVSKTLSDFRSLELERKKHLFEMNMV
jgi:hypothetical protein